MKKNKKESKAKVVIKKRTLSRESLEKMGITFLPEDYLNENEILIFTRIKDKELRSWNMEIEEFIKKHDGHEIFIYPFSDNKISWLFEDGKEYIRGFAK